MKKLGVTMLLGCVFAVLAGPAEAAPAPSTAEAQELCRSVFAMDRCENLADEWANVVATRDSAAIQDFARQLIADAELAGVADLSTECEAIFSDQVCAAIREVGGTVLDIVKNPPTIDEIRYIILWLADCVVHQTCIAPAPDRQGSSADDRVCREVFSDGICDRVEDPVGTVVWLYDRYLRCYLDPACTPTPNIFCNQFYCIVQSEQS